MIKTEMNANGDSAGTVDADSFENVSDNNADFTDITDDYKTDQTDLI